jgi:hypothetical protein
MTSNEIKTLLTTTFGETILGSDSNPAWCSLNTVAFIGVSDDEMYFSNPLTCQYLFLPTVILMRKTCDPVAWADGMTTDSTHFKVADFDGKFYRVSLESPGHYNSTYGYFNVIQSYSTITGLYRLH